MSERTLLKRFFADSRVSDSFSSGKGATRRPGAKAMLAAGVASFMLMLGAVSPAWAQDAQPDTGPAQGNEIVTQDETAKLPATPLASWLNLVRENCDFVTAPGKPDDSVNDASWSDGIFASLDNSPLGKALHEYAAEKNMMVCANPDVGMVQWSSIGSRLVLSSNPDYTPHPVIGPIGDGGAAYAMGLQLRLRQQESAELAPSPQMNPADALLMNRLIRMDAALYMAEMAVDLKYNHDDPALYDAIRVMARFERHAALSSGMMSTLEEQAVTFQQEHVQKSAPDDKGVVHATLTGITLDNGLRRAALDAAAATPQAAGFDSQILSAYDAYLEMGPQLLEKAPPYSVQLDDTTLHAIGNRPGDEDGASYLSGGHDLRSAYYLNTTSTSDAMHLADILMRLAGEQKPGPEGAHKQSGKPAPRTFRVSANPA